jgi:hypothetical protein
MRVRSRIAELGSDSAATMPYPDRMRFVLAVLVVVGFGGLGIYFESEGRTGLYWLCIAAAAITPWFLGMNNGLTIKDSDDSAE